LAQKGVAVDLYHTDKNKGSFQDMSKLFTPGELLNIRFFQVPYPEGRYFPGHYVLKSFQYSRNIFQTLEANYSFYDIIYIQGFTGWYLLKHRKKSASGPVRVVNMHGLEMFQKPGSFRNYLEQRMFRPFAKKQLLRSDYVQSLGGKLTNILETIGVPASRIIVLGIAVEKSWLRNSIPANKGKRTFVFVGRYETRKGIAILNNALKRLIQEDAEFDFHFIGPIPKEHQIFHKDIFYHGLINRNEEITSILDRSDFLVAPSFSEGMPTVILEGMARGCAVIASDVGAVQQLVSSENGYLVEPGNENELYNTLKKALEIDDLSFQLFRERSMELVNEKFTWENFIDKMIFEFKRMMKSEAIG
jgi:glycosyltransferase involved in cell wall biosynthesis